MSVTTATCDALDLLSGGYRVEAYDLPEAVVDEDGKAQQRDGKPASAHHYLDAPWSITVICSGATAAAVRALVAALRFTPGAVLTWAEDGNTALATTLKEVECAGEEYHSTWARIMFTGTRDPFWHGAWKDLTPLSVDCWGTADVVESVAGDVESLVSLSVTSPQATSWIACGIKHAPDANYDPIDDYSGGSDSNAVGGARTANATLSGTYAALGTAPAIDGESNRGAHLLAARVSTDSTATTVRGSSAVSFTGISGSATVSEYPQTVPAAALRSMVLGRVTVPSASSASGDGSGWNSVTITQGNGTLVDVPATVSGGTSYYKLWQTLSFATAARNFSHTLYLKNNGASTISVGRLNIESVSAGVPYSLIAQSADSSDFMEPGGTLTATITLDTELPAGQYAFSLSASGGAGLQAYRSTTAADYAGGQGGHGTSAGDGVDTTIDWKFTTTYEAQTAPVVTTPILAANAGSFKVASLDVAARIPADDLAIVSARSFLADEGFAFDSTSGAVYITNASGVTGISIMDTSNVYGDYLGLIPDAINRVVVAADTPAAAAPSDIAVSGRYRERWLRLTGV